MKREATWEQVATQYEKAILDGPYHRCRSCDCLFFATQVKTREREHMLKNGWTSELLQRLIVPDHVDDTTYLFCSTCSRYIGKHTTADPNKSFPRFNANVSNLRFPEVPKEIKILTDLEERCVALRIPFMKIVALGCDRQYGIRSGVVNVPVDVRKTIRAIPAHPSKSGVIEVSLMRSMKYKHHYQKARIRPYVVWNAAQRLCETPLYRDLNINLDDQWEEGGGTPQTGTSSENTSLQPDMGYTLESEAPAIEDDDNYIEEETLLDASEAIKFAPGKHITYVITLPTYL